MDIRPLNVPDVFIQMIPCENGRPLSRNIKKSNKKLLDWHQILMGSFLTNTTSFQYFSW